MATSRETASPRRAHRMSAKEEAEQFADWLRQDEGRGGAGLRAAQPAHFCTNLFWHLHFGLPSDLLLLPLALERMAYFFQQGDTAFDEHVLFPMYDLRLPLGQIDRVVQAIKRYLTHQQAHTLPTPQPASALLAKVFPPLRAYVEGILAEGLTILAGKPKKGKSYLALDMSLAIAVGREAFRHLTTEQARVLYVSLEDGEARLQRRLKTIQPALATPDGLDFLYSFPRLGEGAVELLAHFATQYQVMILDVLGRLLPQSTLTRQHHQEYERMTELLAPVQALGKAQHCAIIAIDHARKSSAEDIGDTIIGSQGKFGVADHALIYERRGEEHEGLLHVLSRDLDETKVVLGLVDGHLEFLGKGEIYELSAEQNRIIDILKEEGRPMSLPDLMRALGLSPEQHYKRFRVVMHRLYADDRVGRTKRGLYRLYGDTDIEF